MVTLFRTINNTIFAYSNLFAGLVLCGLFFGLPTFCYSYSNEDPEIDDIIDLSCDSLLGISNIFTNQVKVYQ
ncbi:hypothetical protein ACFLU5_10840, partial [Bacteroidota bacterium]